MMIPDTFRYNVESEATIYVHFKDVDFYMKNVLPMIIEMMTLMNKASLKKKKNTSTLDCVYW